jgi:hypothetical protein
MGNLEPQAASFPDAAPHRVEAYFDSMASADNVFEVLADHRGGVKWIGTGVTSIVPTSTPESGVGCTRTVNFFYGAGNLREVFIAWEEGKVWSFTAIGMRPKLFNRFVERVSLEPHGNGGCTIRYQAGMDFSWPVRPFATLIVKVLTRQAPVVLANLSKTAEALPA